LAGLCYTKTEKEIIQRAQSAPEADAPQRTFRHTWVLSCGLCLIERNRNMIDKGALLLPLVEGPN
jgi:hypothetical protein